MTCAAYLRVSSDKQTDADGPERQRQAIAAYCKRNGYTLVAEYFDAGVSGASMDRPQLMAALDYAQSNGVPLLLVESADRFGRDVMVSETLLTGFRSAGVKVVAVDSGTDLTENDDPQAVFIRITLANASQLTKSMLVSRMKAARDRKSAAAGRRVEGRKRADRDKATRIILELGVTGMSFGQIARRLRNYRTPTHGRTWDDNNVRHEWNLQASDEQKAQRAAAMGSCKPDTRSPAHTDSESP